MGVVGRWYQAPGNTPVVTRLDTTPSQTLQARTENQVPHGGPAITKKRLLKLRVSVAP